MEVKCVRNPFKCLHMLQTECVLILICASNNRVMDKHKGSYASPHRTGRAPEPPFTPDAPRVTRPETWKEKKRRKGTTRPSWRLDLRLTGRDWKQTRPNWVRARWSLTGRNLSPQRWKVLKQHNSPDNSARGKQSANDSKVQSIKTSAYYSGSERLLHISRGWSALLLSPLCGYIWLEHY